MGLLEGFLGGAGAGAARAAELAYRDYTETQRDERRNEFQTQRDERQNSFQLERDAAQAKERRDALRESIAVQRELAQQYGKEDIAAAQTALANAGGDPAKALKLVESPGAAKVIETLAKFDNEKLKLNSDLATASASRAASASSVALNGVKADAARLELGEAKSTAGSRDKARGLLSAAENVDMSQPGAENDRKFYEDSARKVISDERMISDKAKDITASQQLQAKSFFDQAAELLKAGDVNGANVAQQKGIAILGGGGATTNSRYPEGTELTGKDGKHYVVQGGVPVLKGDAPAAKKPKPGLLERVMTPDYYKPKDTGEKPWENNSISIR